MVKHYDHLSLQRWPWVEDQFRLQLCLNKLPWDVLSHQPWCTWHNHSKLHQDPNASPGWAVAPSTWIRVWLKRVSDTEVDSACLKQHPFKWIVPCSMSLRSHSLITMNTDRMKKTRGSLASRRIPPASTYSRMFSSSSLDPEAASRIIVSILRMRWP
jgi:hypothetical protein